MSIITSREQKELDIDWYCLINNHPAHIASMGGPIPSEFTERVELRDIEDKVVSLPTISEVNLNENFVKEVTNNGYEYIDDLDLSDFVEETFKHIPSFVYNKNWDLVVRLFTCTFVDKARKGFYSYARKGDSNTYVLIAIPETTLNAKDTDLNLKNLIQGEGKMPEIIEIN